MIEEEYDYRGHHVVVDIEVMEDNQKIWYDVTCPDGLVRGPDVSPYGNQNDCVKKWIDMFHCFGEYFSRIDNGPLTMYDLKLIDESEKEIRNLDAQDAQKSPRDFK